MSQFRTIEIDFDVHKRIEIHRQGFAESPNDVLRRLLEIGDAGAPASSRPAGNGKQATGVKRNPQRQVAPFPSSRKTGQGKRTKRKGGKALGDITYTDPVHIHGKYPMIEANPDPNGKSWWGKDVELRHGTQLRMRYARQSFTGEINNGDWLVEGRVYGGPSGAAMGAVLAGTGKETSINGWRYWKVKRPSDVDWVLINRLR